MEAVVKFSYAKEQDDELSLNVGEVIKEVSKIEEGWCEGTLNGVRGMFPENFVELRPAKSEPIKPEPPKLRAESSDKVRKRRAKVAFSYTAENEDELSLGLGDIVEILGDDEEGWWRGRVNGKEGVFPCNFVEPIPEEDEPPPYTNLIDTNPPPAPSKYEKNGRPPSMVAIPGLGAGINPLDLKQKLKPVSNTKNPLPHLNELPPKSAPERPGGPPPSSGGQSQKNLKAKAMFPYIADQEDEITIKEGDIVDVISMKTEQDGWWLVRLGNNEGLVPDNFLSLIQSAPPSTSNLNAPKPTPGSPDIKSIDTPDNPPLPPKTTPVTRPPPPGAQPMLPGAQPVLPKLPSKSTGDLPRLPSKQPELPEKKESTDEFDIPRQDILDNSSAKEKPKRVARPPSRNTSGLDITETQDDEIEGRNRASSSSKAPWQEELSKRKPKLTPPTPPPHTSNVPAGTPPKPAPSTRPKPVSKPNKPPPNKPTPDHSKETSSPVTTATPTKPPPPVSSSTPVKVPPPAVVTKEESKPKLAPPISEDVAAWKEAFEQLKEQFKKFQEDIRQEMLKEIEILAEDLDNERKKTASMQIDIDRLKKAREYRDNL